MIRIFDPRLLYAAALALSAAAGIAAAAPVQAQDAAAPARGGMTLSSTVMVERVVTAEDGSESVTLASPADVIVVPDDRLLFTLNYKNEGTEPATRFIANNPLPGAVRFASVGQDWAQLSVDGGKNWGKLADLNVAVPATETEPATTRPATENDVTHIRWTFADPVAPGASGTLSYRGVVR